MLDKILRKFGLVRIKRVNQWIDCYIHDMTNWRNINRKNHKYIKIHFNLCKEVIENKDNIEHWR